MRPTTTSAGLLILAKRAFLKKSEEEQHPQRRAHVIVRVREGPGYRIDSLGIARRRRHPRRHLCLIGDEEVVQMAGDKPVTGRLLHDDVDNVLAVEVARMAQEGLFAIIVIFLEVFEFPVPRL